MLTGNIMRNLTLSVTISTVLIACSSGGDATASSESTQKFDEISPVDREPFQSTDVATFKEPWAMTFLPDGRMLVTEKPGQLFLVQQDGEKTEIGNIPAVDYGKQGGLGDIILAPDFADSGTVYLSWVEAGEDDTRGAVVGHANLSLAPLGAEAEAPALSDVTIIWKQTPKVKGRGHFSHRLVFSPDGQYLFIGSGERQKFDPAQDMSSNLGKIVRLKPDGTIPSDNPFIDDEAALPEIWSLGHRNILGIAFDSNGQLWNQEMGPRDGDELNMVQRGNNYGYPFVSEGDHYDGRKIPNHDTRPEFNAPAIAWVPTIAPSGMIFYSGTMFPQWQGNAFIGGLASEALVRVEFNDNSATEAERFKMGARIREVEQAPDGALWVLQDGDEAKLVRITPSK